MPRQIVINDQIQTKVIYNILVRVEDLASHLTHSTMNKDKVFLYSFLLYHCYKNDEL